MPSTNVAALRPAQGAIGGQSRNSAALLPLARGCEARFVRRRAQARGDELLVFVGREVADPRGVGGLVGVDLLCERVAPLRDDRAHVRREHPHVRHQGGSRENEHRPGVVSAAVGEHRILHEVREREHDSRPQRERVRAVLDPRASPNLHESRERARGQQRHARVPRPVRLHVVLHARPAPRLHDSRVHVGEGGVDLVPLFHAGLLDLHEHPPARGLGPSLGHLQLRDHGPMREHRLRGPSARGQRRVVRLLAVQDHCFQAKPDHGRPVLRAGRVPHHRARALRRQGQVLPRRPHPRNPRGARLRA